MSLIDVPRTLDMVPYDYFSPWVSVTLITDGYEFPLWQGTGFIDDGGAEALKFKGTNLAMLQEVLIEWQGMFYSMTINMAPNYDDAIKLIDSYVLQQAVTQVVVKMGFRTSGKGVIEQTFNGVIESVDFSVGTEVTLTLKTIPPPMQAAKTQQSDKKNKREPWKNKSAFDIIKELWEGQKQQGLDYKVKVLPQSGDAGIDALKTKEDAFDGGNKTNWAIIMQLVEANSCTAVADGSTLVIDSLKRAIGVAPPVAAFHLFSGGLLGGNTNAYPITSVSLKTSNLFARSLAGRITVGVDENTGEAKTTSIGLADSDETGADVGAQGLPKDAKKPGGGPSPDASVIPAGGAGATQVQDPNSAAEKRKAVARAVQQWQTQGIELEIESLLIPHLQPHVSVDVSGMGGRIDGRYWILKLFFQVGPDGGLTRFDCIRTGVREGSGQTTPIAAVPNQAPPVKVPEDSGSSETQAESQSSADDNLY